jgi:hypothetical protein
MGDSVPFYGPAARRSLSLPGYDGRRNRLVRGGRLDLSQAAAGVSEAR